MKLTVIRISLIIFLFVIPNVKSLEITEVELNPEGSDSGHEWIELFSEEEIQIDNYFLENNDNDVYNLTGTFSDYFVIEFSSQWLDNSDEKVFLKKDNEIIDETIILEDSKNDDFSLQKCDDEWLFIQSTKEQENKCEEETEIEDDSEEKKEKQAQSPPKSFTKLKTNTIKQNLENENIVLNSPAKPQVSSLITKQEKKRIMIIYFFTGFCVILIILLALRRL